MRCEEVIEMLNQHSMNDLGGNGIDEHAVSCDSCRRKVNAARLAHELVVLRAGETVRPPLYFYSKLMERLGETGRRAENSFLAMWHSARVVVCSMVLLLVALAVMNVVHNRPSRAVAPADEVSQAQDSVERMMTRAGDPQSDRNLSNAQVLDTLFAPEENYGAY